MRERPTPAAPCVSENGSNGKCGAQGEDRYAKRVSETRAMLEKLHASGGAGESRAKPAPDRQMCEPEIALYAILSELSPGQ